MIFEESGNGAGHQKFASPHGLAAFVSEAVSRS
jgi:hypothetical protein